MIGTRMTARRILHGIVSSGAEPCCSCGLECLAEHRVAKAASDAFTSWDELRILPGEFLCSGCAALMKDARLRFASLLMPRGGELRKLLRDEMLPAYESQESEFVATWAISHKKHCWLHAGVSTPEEWKIGSDMRTIRYRLADHAPVRESVFWLLDRAVPCAQIMSGIYHPSILSRLNRNLLDADELLAPHRASGLVEWLVFVGPRTKSPLEEKINAMIDPEDALAGNFLAELVRNSEYRISRPLDFWGGFLDARIERVRNLPLGDQVTRLMQYLVIPAVNTAEIIDYMQRLTAEDTAQIEASIRARPRLVTALAYSRMKEKREAKKSEKVLRDKSQPNPVPLEDMFNDQL